MQTCYNIHTTHLTRSSFIVKSLIISTLLPDLFTGWAAPEAKLWLSKGRYKTLHNVQWINILIIFTQLFETLILGRQLRGWCQACMQTGKALPAHLRLRLSGRSPVTGPGRGRGSRPCGMTSTTRGAAGVAGPFKRFWGKLSMYHLCHESSLYSTDFSYKSVSATHVFWIEFMKKKLYYYNCDHS